MSRDPSPCARRRPAPARLLAGAALAAGLLAASLAPAAAEAPPGRDARASALLLFHQPACPWCARWEQEIGVAYPHTAAGRRAPLRRVDMSRPLPDDLAGLGDALEPVRFSPTFVLLHGAQEIGRIVGYPGEHFFWPLLEELLARLPAAAPDLPPASH